MTKTDSEKDAKCGADNMRCVAEGAFPTFKRIFGEHVISIKQESAI